ncbi:MAG: hypothetical protein IKS42_05310 [Oscillospiraceae bacterium]|nr:hypothetical protein [Oscillospiraceae bacterium]
MKKYMIAAAALLSICMLTGCGDKTESSSLTAETTTSASDTTETTADTTAGTETTTSAAETTTSGEGDTAGETTDSAAETTAAAQETTTASAASEAQSTAASSADTQAPASSAAKTETQPVQQKCLFDEIRLGGDCTAYITANTSYSLEKAPSCLGEGEDRTYTYSNMKIVTYFENGKETIHEIDLTGPGVKTRSGIEVGMKASDITAAHGASSFENDYIYPTTDGTIEYRMNGDTIEEIWVYAGQ